MEIREHYDLTAFNTFGVEAHTRFFAVVESKKDLIDLSEIEAFQENPKLFLGGGSNILFTHDFPGFVLLNKLTGIEILKEDTENVWLKVMGGENWHELVLFTTEHAWWGIENLAYIPGSVGGAPVQNIGAYGAELKDVLVDVDVYDTDLKQKVTFKKEECNFGYRDSIFKNVPRGKYFVLSITLLLSKKPKPNTTYKVLAEYLAKNNIQVQTPRDIAHAVTEIRKSKLPDPKVIGNAGSFFKNVFVTVEEKNELAQTYPDLPFFEDAGQIKVPAGWLIEQCGWKGQRIGNVGVHDKQALVLVNYGGSSGEDVLHLARSIIQSVQEKFGIILTPEVNII